MAKVIVETSARHLHVTDEHLEILFGKGHTLTNKKELSQPGQFVCTEKVTIVGPKGETKCSIIGPTRAKTQVELSLTDARAIGVTPPIRESGDVAGSAPCKLVGPEGEVEISEGVIVAKRHVHLDTKTAEEYGLKSGDIINIKVGDRDRNLIFGDVVVRVKDTFLPAVHIDTDEANAAGLQGTVEGEIIK